jgi:MrcB-like, N-terminal domain
MAPAAPAPARIAGHLLLGTEIVGFAPTSLAVGPQHYCGCMSLRDVLSAPLRLQYVPGEGPGQPAQVALREGRTELQESLPPGYRVKVSGAAVNLPIIPWLAVLDVEVTTTAQEGLYVVYLFADTLERVYLAINQGVTAHREYFRRHGVARPGQAALEELQRESALLREGLRVGARGLIPAIRLGGDGFLPRAYEAGSIVAKTYAVSSLPAEAVLRADLDDGLALYRDGSRFATGC